jgi:hypothetical protein
MNLSNNQLDEYIHSQELVAISRKHLDSHKLQGFPLAYSNALLLLRHVYDFHLDGLLLLRRRDITAIDCRDTDRFQRKLLQTENRLKRTVFQTNHSIGSFRSFLNCLDSNKIVIIENEAANPKEFFIGRIAALSTEKVDLREFSGAGNWDRENTTIAHQSITCCQVDTNYIKFYSRHFQRSSG